MLMRKIAFFHKFDNISLLKKKKKKKWIDFYETIYLKICY